MIVSAPARGIASVRNNVTLKVIMRGCDLLAWINVFLDTSSISLGALLEGIWQQRVVRCGYVIDVCSDDAETFTAVNNDAEFVNAISMGKRTFRATVVRS